MTYQNIVSSPNAENWQVAVWEDKQALQENETFIVVFYPNVSVWSVVDRCLR